MLSLYKLVVASTLALSAAAKTIRVDVGKGGKMFTPNTLEAAKGDLLEFHFFAVNHSVVQGRFDKPCQPAQSKPIFSGFQGPIAAGQEGPRVFQVTVNDTDPLVFYCSQNVGFHCASGMFAVVNGGARPANLDGYKAQISGNLTAVTPPGGPSGGVFSVQSNVSNTTTTATTDSGSGSPTATPATTATNTDVQTTAAPTGSASSSAAGGSGAPQTTSTKPAAGANVRASFGGLVGAALFAGLMM